MVPYAPATAIAAKAIPISNLPNNGILITPLPHGELR